jgi:hypothetical protein
MMSSMTTRAAAVRAAERDWYVFPVRAGGKEPRGGLSWPKAAINDPAMVARCAWRPGENYGIAAKPSGLVILDLDWPKPGYVLPQDWRDEPGLGYGGDVLAALCERHGQAWPETFRVQTPRLGDQLYFRAPAGRSIGNHSPWPLIDVRGGGQGNGGYVVGPGSVVDERAYKEPEIRAQVAGGRPYVVVDDPGDPLPELPAWIADLLDPPAETRVPGTVPRGLPSGVSERVAARLDGLIAAVLDAPTGEGNNMLHWAACRAAEMIAAGQVTADEVHACLGEAAARRGRDDREAHRTIASALRQTLRSCA